MPFAVFVACDGDDGNIYAPPRTTNPVPVDASEDATDDATIEDGGSDADVDADADAEVPKGILALATGSGPHPDALIGYGDHSCAIAGSSRSVYCWGANDHGQLGIGNTADGGATPLDVPSATRLVTDEQGLPFSGASELALAAWHGCARIDNGLYCWGQRFAGAQAEPPFSLNPDRLRPRLLGNVAIARVAAGGAHTCTLFAKGGIACFGHSSFNELGRPNTDDPACDAPIFYPYPNLVTHKCSGDIAPIGTTLPGVMDMASGELHTCAITNGKVRCWGTNGAGQLGKPGAGIAEATPLEVTIDSMLTPLTGVQKIASGGGKHTCALVSGAVWCWGSNASGELGVDPVAVPQRANAAALTGLSGVTTIGAADGVTCAVKTDGTVWCWGADDVGQLGDGVPKPNSPTPVQVKGTGGAGVLDNVRSVSPGKRHVCVVKNDETVWCWGKNDRGQVGDGSTTDAPYPVKVKGLPE